MPKNKPSAEKPMGKLTVKEELFCQSYVELLGNGTQAAVAAFDIDMEKKNWQNTAASIAKEYLRKPHLLARVRELLNLAHMNDESVDAEVAFCLRQNEDLNVKMKAAEMYNKLGGRYQKDNEQKRANINIDGINYITPDKPNN